MLVFIVLLYAIFAVFPFVLVFNIASERDFSRMGCEI
jgi:hypothetical protein